MVASLYPEGTLTTYSFSKWLGLAGLRLGAVVASPDLLGRLTAVQGNPLGANIQAQRAAIAGMKVKGPWLQRLRAINRANHEIAAQALARSGVGKVLVWPSHGNFLAADVSDGGWTGDTLAGALLDRDVFIRSGTYQSPAFGQRFVKISTSVPTEWVERFADALSTLSVPQKPPTGQTLRNLGVPEQCASSGVALGRRVAAGEVSPVQLAECALHIARTIEPRINAYAGFLEERALTQAAEREREAKDGRPRGALHGVPIAIKDNFYYQGEAAGKGSRTSSDVAAATSSPMVERLVAAGAVIIGKTTTPEFGWKATGISPRTGVTRNPWDVTRNTGGSSAGSGATVASGAVPIALGSDAGGSIRVPASFCGVVGIKPTLGAIPVWPGTVNENLSHAGPLTRSVEDARAVLGITRGPDARDPQSYFSAPPQADVKGRRLRVGVIGAPFGIEPDGDVQPIIAKALSQLGDAGVAEFEETDLNVGLPRDVFEALWVTGRGLGFLDLFAAHADIMDPGLVRLGPLAQSCSLREFYAAMTKRREFNAAMFNLLDQWDLLIMPTMPLTAFAAEAEVPENGEADAPLPWITWTPYTYPFNISGQPAISIPCGLSRAGMPVGLQIVGPWAHDLRVLDFAQTCETILALPANQRIAPMKL